MPEWTWDPDKEVKNLREHGLSLADGVPVLEGDPLAESRPDPHPDGDRWQTIGGAGGFLVLFVVHTEPVMQADGRNPGRIISVRRATSLERKAYEEGAF
jgi:uncharacterized protein